MLINGNLRAAASIAPLLFYLYLSARSALRHVYAASFPVGSRFQHRRSGVVAPCDLSTSSNNLRRSRVRSLQHIHSPFGRTRPGYLVVQEHSPYHKRGRCLPGCSSSPRERIDRVLQVNCPVCLTSLSELLDAHPW